MFNKEGINKIQLRWKAIKRITLNDNTSKIIYDRTKESPIKLKQFIKEERSKEAEIELDYLIDGKDLAFHLNLNYFMSRYVGNSNGVKNSLPMSYNYSSLEDVNFSYQKLLIKRLLGQQLNYEDCRLAIIKHTKPEDLDERTIGTMKHENKDTMLYSSACCGDRLCGYIGMQVYQTETSFIWDIGLTKQPLRLEFSKENYLSEFREYIDLVNSGLKSVGSQTVDTTSPGKRPSNFDDGVELVKLKYFDKSEKISLETLEKIFQSENIEVIDKGIYIAVENGIDSITIINKIEEDYNELPDIEKSGLDWDIIDESAYMRTKNLKFRSASMKAYLLYKRTKGTEANM